MKGHTDMASDPAVLASQTKESKTEPDDIGHVAPDFQKGTFFNTLVIRPEYRISLRLGEIENLFLNPPGTPAGRMERLQVLGLFYFPLGHKKAQEAFDGLPSATPPVLGAWEYFKQKILGGVDDAAADTEATAT